MKSKLTREEAEASLNAWRAKFPYKRARKKYAALGDDLTLSRFAKPQTTGLPAKKRNANHAAFKQARSIYHVSRVKQASEVSRVLISGYNNSKIGRDVRKGRLFRNYWIYTLTLEERATCPQTCKHWNTCYGNNMQMSRRIVHGPPLMAAISNEVRKLLAVRGRVGVLIRLHVLGDFWSPEYVKFWSLLLTIHPRLAVFGYTAWHPGTPIGDAIAKVKNTHGSRFAIRWSDGEKSDDCTVSIKTADECPSNAFVCPEQTGRTEACATCAACWNTKKNVAFLQH